MLCWQNNCGPNGFLLRDSIAILWSYEGDYKPAVISRFEASFHIARFLCVFKTDCLRTFQYSLQPLPPVQGQKLVLLVRIRNIWECFCAVFLNESNNLFFLASEAASTDQAGYWARGSWIWLTGKWKNVERENVAFFSACRKPIEDSIYTEKNTCPSLPCSPQTLGVYAAPSSSVLLHC